MARETLSFTQVIAVCNVRKGLEDVILQGRLKVYVYHTVRVYVTLWQCMSHCGSVCHTVAAYVTLWQHMSHCGSVCHTVAVYVNRWLLVVLTQTQSAALEQPCRSMQFAVGTGMQLC